MNTPIRLEVVRWQCPHCRITRAKRAAMEAHVARCWANPANRACRTCTHLVPAEDGPYPEHPGWGEECGADVAKPGALPVTACASWEARP